MNPPRPQPPEPSPLLAALTAELPPPPELRSRVASELARRDQLRHPPRRRQPWLALAASLAGLAVGWWLRGPDVVPAPVVSSPAPLFLLLLEGEPSGGPAEGTARVNAYRHWAQQLRAAGELAAAEKLTPTTVTVDLAGSTHQPLAATSPSGFFLVHAVNLERALAIAKASPHVRFGGTVTVRPVDPT